MNKEAEFTHVALSSLIINVSQVCKIASRSSLSIFPFSLLPLAFPALVHSVFLFLLPRGLSPLSVSNVSLKHTALSGVAGG